jgi:signal transduction histidine kinase
VQSLRIFSRLDERECKPVDIHEGIDSALLILNHRLTQNPDSPKIQVIKEYGELPLVECYPSQLNQVFMNILSNAIDALENADISWVMGDEEESSIYPLPISRYQSPTIRIHTEVVEDKRVVISIADNGSGIKADIQLRIFDPFFTTKPVGKGTGLGLSISYQIVVEKHEGKLRCHSVPRQGTEFVIELPIARHSSGLDQCALAAMH